MYVGKTLGTIVNDMWCMSAPDLQLKFAMWGLGQEDNSEPGVWQSVMEQQIGLSAEQMKALREFREPVMELVMTRSCVAFSIVSDWRLW